jgi:hypothetical protein
MVALSLSMGRARLDRRVVRRSAALGEGSEGYGLGDFGGFGPER